jgi:hypothetical protein
MLVLTPYFKIMKSYIFLTLVCFFSFSELTAQVEQDSSLIAKAAHYESKGKFKKAMNLYQKLAVRYGSSNLLHKAALNFEKMHDGKRSYCAYFERAKNRINYQLKEEEIFFYGCDPSTFERIK